MIEVFQPPYGRITAIGDDRDSLPAAAARSAKLRKLLASQDAPSAAFYAIADSARGDLRARAIETQCWVIAAGQWGSHDDGGLRESYPHDVEQR